MKPFLFLLASIIICTSIKAQLDYIPVAKDGNLWIYETTVDNGARTFCNGWYTIGDSTVNNKKYLKVFKVDIEENDNNDLIYTLAKEPFALLRDDSLTQQSFAVFLQHPNNYLFSDSIYNCIKYDDLQAEVLLYDYSLDTGDTIKSCYDIGYDIIVINKQQISYFGKRTYSYEGFYNNVIIQNKVFIAANN